MLNTTLPQHLEHAKNNLNSLIQTHPDLYLAAEQINDLFDQLFTERIVINKGDSTKNRKQFDGIFSIPTAYFSPKYKHLRPLLVWFDYASDFGTHGNYAALVTKWKEEKENKFTMSFHDSPERVPVSSGSSIKIGSLLIESIVIDLKDNLRNIEEIYERTNTMKELIKRAAIEIAGSKYDGNIPLEILQSINNDDRDALGKHFDDLMKTYQSK